MRGNSQHKAGNFKQKNKRFKSAKMEVKTHKIEVQVFFLRNIPLMYLCELKIVKDEEDLEEECLIKQICT